MAPNTMKLTASKSSKLSHKSLINSQLKKTKLQNQGYIDKKQPEYYLPSEQAIVNEINKEKLLKKEEFDKQQKLQVLNYDCRIYDDLNLELEADEGVDDYLAEYYGSKGEDPLITAINQIQLSQFDNNYPPIAKGGLTKKSKLEIETKREAYPRLVLVNQLYSVFPSNPTFVDQAIQKLVDKGKIKQLRINHKDFHDNLVIKNEDYMNILETFSDDGNVSNFIKFLTDNRSANNVNLKDSEKYEFRIDDLISKGLLNISTEKTAMDSEKYYLSVPNIGGFLKLIQDSKKFVFKVIGTTKWKEALESKLEERWNYKNRKWYYFKGLNLKWVLSYCAGAGTLEVFNTPVGKGWKITGK
ncbi:BA75_00494T0 [Komagataella pastoris]|uniref:BA75_00494T0 n=1 Tax=Komagataella pastoris TaxID=4922 RepID=A0A1B2J9U5_PICPA|nr:BA75_00494T0 [Komagataella pastoris]